MHAFWRALHRRLRSNSWRQILYSCSSYGARFRILAATFFAVGLYAVFLLGFFLASAGSPASPTSPLDLAASLALVMTSPPGLRVDSSPFLSYETLRDLCDLRVDGQGPPADRLPLPPPPADGRPLRIFVETDHLPSFAAGLLPRLRSSFVLVSSSNHDHVVPMVSSAAENATRPAYERVLAHPGLEAWFGTNVMLAHPKLVAVPLANKWNWFTTDYGKEPRAALVRILRRRAIDPASNFARRKPFLLAARFAESSTYSPTWAGHRGERQRWKRHLDRLFDSPKETTSLRALWVAM